MALTLQKSPSLGAEGRAWGLGLQQLKARIRSLGEVPGPWGEGGCPERLSNGSFLQGPP